MLYFLAWKDVKVKYKQTVVGAAWAVVQPLFTMVVFTFLLGGLVEVPTDGIPYPIFSYTGLVLWTYFSNSVNAGANSMIANSSLVTKVNFPRALIPISPCIVGLLDLGIASTNLGRDDDLLPGQSSITILLFLVPVIMTFALAAGLSFWLSAVNVRYRDVVYLVPFFIQILLFASPILYATSIIPENLSWVLYLNPMAGIMSLQRGVFLGAPVDWTLVGCALVIITVVFFAGLFYFRQYEKDFADVI